jgi:hypothetical protein
MNNKWEDCGFFHDKPELVVTDLYTYQAKSQRFYNKLDHFKEVLGQFKVERGNEFTPKTWRASKLRFRSPRTPTQRTLKKLFAS